MPPGERRIISTRSHFSLEPCFFSQLHRNLPGFRGLRRVDRVNSQLVGHVLQLLDGFRFRLVVGGHFGQLSSYHRRSKKKNQRLLIFVLPKPGGAPNNTHTSFSENSREQTEMTRRSAASESVSGKTPVSAAFQFQQECFTFQLLARLSKLTQRKNINS